MFTNSKPKIYCSVCSRFWHHPPPPPPPASLNPTYLFNKKKRQNSHFLKPFIRIGQLCIRLWQKRLKINGKQNLIWFVFLLTSQLFMVKLIVILNKFKLHILVLGGSDIFKSRNELLLNWLCEKKQRNIGMHLYAHKLISLRGRMVIQMNSTFDTSVNDLDIK